MAIREGSLLNKTNNYHKNMSKQQVIRTIRSEIDRLNREIDLRIIKGASYRREALRHKFLMAELARLAPKRSWFARSLSFASMFLF
ncbi:MAG: hypothetical protein WC648_00090 [Candidatus Paceibacterota bacterium]